MIGAVDENTNNIRTNLAERSYSVTSQETDHGTLCVRIVGKDTLATLRALQCFYSRSVINGSFALKELNLASANKEIRDPAVIYYNGAYYTYENDGHGWSAYKSTDRLNWTSIGSVFNTSQHSTTPIEKYCGFSTNEEALAMGWKTEGGTDINARQWAPEVHEYNGKYYLFGSYQYKNVATYVESWRGTAVFVSDTPEGPFVPWSDGYLTPDHMDCIDGTLYVKDGTPYLVYSVEFTNSPDSVGGYYAYLELKNDLSAAADGAQPKTLFYAKDAPWSRANKAISDAPWLYTCKDGSLLMLWSGKDENGNYFVSVAKSSDGTLSGEWTHVKLLYSTNDTDTAFDPYRDGDNIYCVTDGGHAMIYADRGGRLYLSLHTVNETDDAKGLYTSIAQIPLVEKNGMLYLDLLY